MKPKVKKRKKYLDPATVLLIKQIFYGVIAFILLALFITLIWYTTRLSTFTISEVVVEGGVTINKENIENQAQELLAGTYFKLIPRSFSYLYPEEEIYNAVNQIDRIKDVKVDRVSRKKILITFDEYLPEALWCHNTEEGNCYFLDENAYAFDKAPNLSGSSLIRYYAGETPFDLGTKPFRDDYYQNSREFTYLIDQLGWFVKKIEINSVGDVFYTLAGGGEIKANLDMPALETITNLQTIINSDDFSHLKPGNFQYLDLRFGSRIFVNEVVDVPETETGTSTEEVEDADVEIE